jgi:hypothetical protein
MITKLCLLYSWVIFYQGFLHWFDWPLLGAAKAKNRKTFKHLLLQNQLMDDYQTLSVAFLGTLLSSLLILI